MFQKKQFSKVIISIIIVMLFLGSCASTQFLKQAESNWEAGEVYNALINACKSQQEKSNERAMIFLKDHYQEGILAIEEEINTLEDLSKLDKATKKAEIYRQLIEINNFISFFVFPFSDRKKTFSWTPEEIKNYASDLENAQREMANATLEIAANLQEWSAIHEQGEDAIVHAPTQEDKDKITGEMAQVFYEKAMELIQSDVETDLISALAGFEFCQKWVPSYNDTDEQIFTTKNRIAETYYAQGAELATVTTDRESLKEAIVAFETTLFWVPDYKDSQTQIVTLKDILAIYFYYIIEEDDYNYFVATVESEVLPQDLRGVSFENLYTKLENKTNVRIDKESEKGSYHLTFLPDILSRPSASKYSYPMFIAAAEKMGLHYVAIIRINSGAQVGDTLFDEIISTQEENIEKRRIRIFKRAGLRKSENFIDLSRKELATIGSILPKGELNFDNLCDDLLAFLNNKGADISREEKGTVSTEIFEDKASYSVSTHTFSYPLSVSYDIVDIKSFDKAIVKSNTINLPITGKFKEYISAVDDEEQFSWVTGLKFGFFPNELSVIDETLVTEAVVKNVIDTVNTEIAGYLNEID